MSGAAAARTTRLIDIVFPGATNHHGTLFGGAGLALMDRVAFIAAARYARADFVTASCERIDFAAPAQLRDIVELTGRVSRVGRRPLGIEVEMMAEAPLAGARRRCTVGVFTMVAVERPAALPPVSEAVEDGPEALRMADLVMPGGTSHYGGSALAFMAKGAFVVATRHSRRAVVMAAAPAVEFAREIRPGAIIEVEARPTRTGRSSMTVETRLWTEALGTGQRHPCGTDTFVMVAVNEAHRPVALPP